MTTFNIKDLPALPRGLEYEIPVQPTMCPNCMGIVAAGNPLVRMNHRRKSIFFEKYFPKEDGFCLNCTRNQMGIMVAEFYEKAEAQIDAIYRVEQGEQSNKSEIVSAMNEVVDSIQAFINLAGKYIGEISKNNVEYIHQPTQDIIGDRRKEGVDND